MRCLRLLPGVGEVQVLVGVVPRVLQRGAADLSQVDRQSAVCELEHPDLGVEDRDVSHRLGELRAFRHADVDGHRDGGERGDDRHDDQELDEGESGRGGPPSRERRGKGGPAGNEAVPRHHANSTVARGAWWTGNPAGSTRWGQRPSIARPTREGADEHHDRALVDKELVRRAMLRLEPAIEPAGGLGVDVVGDRPITAEDPVAVRRGHLARRPRAVLVPGQHHPFDRCAEPLQIGRQGLVGDPLTLRAPTPIHSKLGQDRVPPAGDEPRARRHAPALRVPPFLLGVFVRRDDHPPVRPEHAPDFGERLQMVVDEVDHVDQEDDVEDPGAERQRHRVGAGQGRLRRASAISFSRSAPSMAAERSTPQ